MKFMKDKRIHRKRNKARRNLEKMLNHYGHNNIVLQLQINSYIHNFCRTKYGEVFPDAYIESYITRVEDKMRQVTE